MSIPRDHHFIPAFALTPWAIKDGELVEYSIKYRKLISKWVGPRGTGFVRDLYAFPELPPEHAQHLEAVFFNYADDKAAQALGLHLRSEAGWDNELISAWSRFIIGIHLRHPDLMPELRAASGSIWDQSGAVYQAHYEQLRRPSDPATMDEWIAKLDPLTRSKVQLNCIIKILDNEIIGTHLNSMRWSVIDVSNSPFRFLMSDRPVEICQLKEPAGFVSIPISPTKLFVAVNQEQSIRNLGKRKPEEIVRHVNLFVATRARRFVWANDESQTAFIREHISAAMEPTPFFLNLDKYDSMAALAQPAWIAHAFAAGFYARPEFSFGYQQHKKALNEPGRL
jgi:Protein of unknown function (DUF4238)